MARSLRKPPFVARHVVKKLQRVLDKTSGNSRNGFDTYSRATTIIPDMIGMTIGVHNGLTFVQVFVSEEMIGDKLGMYAPTRKFVKHAGDRKS